MFIIRVDEITGSIIVEILKCGLRLKSYQSQPRFLEAFDLVHLLLRDHDLFITEREVGSNLVRKDWVATISTNKYGLLLEQAVGLPLNWFTQRFFSLTDQTEHLQTNLNVLTDLQQQPIQGSFLVLLLLDSLLQIHYLGR